MVELNKCYCMDNLELMKQIDDSSIDLIYSDILYGTGKKFKDYQDLKADKEEIYEFYIPRIKEMHRILKSTGTIYLQMDYRINHWIRCIMGDIFGYENMRNEIIWHYDIGTNLKLDLKRKHDTIFRYTKSKIYKFHAIKIPVKNLDRYDKTEEYTGRKFMIRGDTGKIVYADEGQNEDDVWTYYKTDKLRTLNSMSKERTGYNTQKPKELLERIIKMSTDEGDIIADFFCGSGTTGIVAKELCRKYIMCDINPRAIEISEERLK